MIMRPKKYQIVIVTAGIFDMSSWAMLLSRIQGAERELFVSSEDLGLNYLLQFHFILVLQNSWRENIYQK